MRLVELPDGAAVAPGLLAVTGGCTGVVGSVWAMCGDTEVKKWGVGPEGEAKAANAAAEAAPAAGDSQAARTVRAHEPERGA